MAKKAGIKKNLFYSLAYQILNIVLPLITSPYVARVLGAKSVGIYSKSQAFAHYFLLFAMLGVNNYGNRAIARVRDRREEVSRTFWEIFSFQLLTSVCAVLIYLVYSLHMTSTDRFIYLMQIFYVMSGLVDVNWFCFGMEKFRLTTIRSTIVRVLMTVAVFVFVKRQEHLWVYTFIISFGSIASSVAVWPFVLKHVDFVRPAWDGIKQHIKPNLVLFWPVIAVSLYNIMDKLMLGWFSEDEEVAFYTYAERIVTIPTTLILALDNVIMPRMSNLFAAKDNADQIRFLMDTVMLFAMFMAVAMGFGVAGVADVFAPWFYGSAFVRCGYFILLLSPVIVIKGWAGALRTQFIIPTGRDKIYVASLTTGAIVNLVLNALLIPKLNGVGAIIGTIAAEFAVCFIQFFWCRKDIDLKKYMTDGLSFCVVGAVMFWVVRALSHVSGNALITLIVQVICGAAVYTVFAGLYMIRIRKNPVLVNEALKLLHVSYRFKM